MSLKKQLPSSIKVGSITYDITVSPENERWHNLTGEYGHIDFIGRVIAISIDNSFEQKRDTLVHEIMHAIVKHMRLDEAWKEDDEDFTKRLSNGLNMVFRDNPDFIRLLGM